MDGKGGEGGEGMAVPQKFFVVEAKQMDQEVEDEGVIELEKKTILQYLSNLFRVLLLQLLLSAELLEGGRKAAVPSDNTRN